MVQQNVGQLPNEATVATSGLSLGCHVVVPSLGAPLCCGLAIPCDGSDSCTTHHRHRQHPDHCQQQQRHDHSGSADVALSDFAFLNKQRLSIALNTMSATYVYDVYIYIYKSTSNMVLHIYWVCDGPRIFSFVFSKLTQVHQILQARVLRQCNNADR